MLNHGAQLRLSAIPMFAQFTVEEALSQSVVLGRSGSTVGIYVLEFADGTASVGQTQDLVATSAAHRRTHRDIVAIRFAPCAATDLDSQASAVARHEVRTKPLRDQHITRTGASAASLESIPTPRPDRSLITETAYPAVVPTQFTPSLSGRANLRKLRAGSRYPDLVAVIGQYLHATMPNPAATQGLWTLTAPAHKARDQRPTRLATLSIGQQETLFVTDEPMHLGRSTNFIGLNLLADRALEHQLNAFAGKWSQHGRVSRPSPTGPHPLVQIRFNGFEAAAVALADGVIREGASRLNAELMRGGAQLFSRHHNAPFAADALRAADAYAASPYRRGA